MAIYKSLGDIISGIQAQSRPGVTFTVVPQGNGLSGVLRNGVLSWQFLYEPSGLMHVTDRNGASIRTDPSLFIQSLV